jgi:hypothetical protein
MQATDVAGIRPDRRRPEASRAGLTGLFASVAMRLTTARVIRICLAGSLPMLRGWGLSLLAVT